MSSENANPNGAGAAPVKLTHGFYTHCLTCEEFSEFRPIDPATGVVATWESHYAVPATPENEAAMVCKKCGQRADFQKRIQCSGVKCKDGPALWVAFILVEADNPETVFVCDECLREQQIRDMLDTFEYEVLKAAPPVNTQN